MKTTLKVLAMMKLILSCTGLAAQSYPDTSKSISVQQHMQAGELLKSIRAAGFEIDYPGRSINKRQVLEFAATSITVGFGLNKLARDFGLKYEFTCSNCISFGKPEEPANVKDSINGRVINERGEPVPAATIRNLSSGEYIIARNNGRFTIKRMAQDPVLVVSSVNHFEKTVKAGHTDELLITLTPSGNTLEEIRNIGYVKTSFKSNTAAFSTIKTDKVANTSNILLNLIGQVPGLQIIRNNGLLNSTPSLSIRGQVRMNIFPGTPSIPQGDPLLIVNGVPFPPGVLPSGWNRSVLGDPTIGAEAGGLSLLSMFNWDDFAEITVLKDADAMAIYGANGASGVILISTKSARKGPLEFNINYNEGSGIASRIPPMLNFEQYERMRMEFMLDGKSRPGDTIAPEIKAWGRNRNINWGKEILGNTARSRNLHISVSGGDSILSFSAGFGYIRQTSILPLDFPFSRITQYLSASFQPTKKLSIITSINTGVSADELPVSNPMDHLKLPPNAPDPIDMDTIVFRKNDHLFMNPYGAFRNINQSASTGIHSSMVIEYKFNPRWIFRLNAGAGRISLFEKNILPIASFPELIDSAYIETATSSYKLTSFQPQLHHYRRDTINNIDFNYLLGVNYYTKSISWNKFHSAGLQNDSLLSRFNKVGSHIIGHGAYRFFGVFSRMNISWNEKYSISITGKLDNSSTMESGKPSFYWAWGSAWNFARKKGSSNTPRIIREGKLRFSIGTSGNDGSQNYGYIARWEKSWESLINDSASEKIQPVNHRKVLEKNLSTQVAVDLKINDWLTITGNVFLSRTSSSFSNLPAPGDTGTTEKYQLNYDAIIVNRGFELDIQTDLIPRENRRWHTRLLLSVTRNKLVSLDGLEHTDFKKTLQTGKSLTAIIGLKSAGLDPSTRLFTFVNQDADINISVPEDAVVLGDYLPALSGSFTNNFRFNKVDIDFMLEGRIQHVTNPAYFAYQGGSPGRYPTDRLSNQSTIILEDWVQKFTSSNSKEVKDAIAHVKKSELALSKASYINVSSIRVTWRLPMSWFNRLPVTSPKLFIECQNLATWSNYRYADPLISSPNQMPTVRTFITGFQITL